MELRLATALLVLCGVLCDGAAAQAPVVTETKWVENWDEKGTPREQLRKINGRWWTQDNREVQPPGKGGGFWSIDSKPGTCTFYHHRPLEMSRAEVLHLFMSSQDVEAVLGQPNRTLGAGRQGFWFYYAADGTKLSVRFMGEDGLGQAKYEYVQGGSRAVASVAEDLGGRDIYKVLAERASQRVRERELGRSSEFRANGGRRGARPSVVTVDPVPVAAADPVPVKRVISAEAFASVKVGAAREDVLTELGEPSSSYTISDDDGPRESFTYDLESGGSAVIRLAGGRVTEVRKP
ncbi:MAG TPA: hypothetical protein VFW44_22300 [Bryobacteraceae bacterium]|nr:hypothetical protein [Bryobacteraceae bacterium]